jgi:hypothetical protein
VSQRVAIVARPPNQTWWGPLRAWLEQRSRELRDHHVVRRVQIVDHFSGGDLDSTGVSWTLVIEFAHAAGADVVVRDVLADLTVLDASPELTELSAAS